ncbi:hypothetical protein [Carboxylicivirga sp. M1479]|uniref:hypothetical protein n=1 Tax=Carboxylicivirga sp. M1479 TaxID=2594476 RepID=UPI0011788B77|nr:hypothetical protein [Carboxylicivirga sp. M1479]TRX71687.1 hypothetical protein FNN09_05460 [Carboxylicivirga sp. M1479]
MKKTLIILLGITSLTASLGDSFNIFVFKLNQEYIAKYLCVEKDVEDNSCQGCCHLKKQMEQQNEQDKSNPNPVKRKLIIDFFRINKLMLTPINPVQSIKYCWTLLLIKQSFYSEVFKPPQVLM